MFVIESNALGKTTLMDAIRWAIFGRGLDKRDQELRYFLNFSAYEEGDWHVGVNLIFEHDGQTYDLFRVAKPKSSDRPPKNECDFTVEIRLSKNNTAIPSGQIYEELDQLFPMLRPRLLFLNDNQLTYGDGDLPSIDPHRPLVGRGDRLLEILRNIANNHEGPIIYDSPIGPMDHDQQRKLSASLADHPYQMVFLVSEIESDRFKDMEKFREGIGFIYEIKSLSSGSSRLELLPN